MIKPVDKQPSSVLPSPTNEAQGETLTVAELIVIRNEATRLKRLVAVHIGNLEAAIRKF